MRTPMARREDDKSPAGAPTMARMWSLAGGALSYGLGEMSDDVLQRRRRIAMIAHVLAFPDLVDAEYETVRAAAYASEDRRVALLEKLERMAREVADADARIRSDLPDLFGATSPSENRRAQFDEVYKALLRDAEACGLGLWRMRHYLETGLSVPGAGGKPVRVPASMIPEAVDIEEPRRVLRMAAEQIAECFPIDEVTDAKSELPWMIQEVIMGDKFENIQNATIVNRSQVENAFNTTRETLGPDVADAIVQLAEVVERSQNAAAGAIFQQFTSELEHTEPDRSKLRQLWDGLVALVPDISAMAGVAATIGKLFL
jgi:hypothetical protein